MNARATFHTARRLACCALAACLLLGTTAACNRKSGCPASEAAHIRPDKKGEYKKQKTKSNLFPKEMRKHVSRG